MRTIEGIANPIDHATPTKARCDGHRLLITARIEARKSAAEIPSTDLAPFGKATKVSIAIVAPVNRRLA
jgi:hypothetical protein